MLHVIAEDSMRKIRISYKYKNGMPNRNQEKNKPWFTQDCKESYEKSEKTVLICAEKLPQHFSDCSRKKNNFFAKDEESVVVLKKETNLSSSLTKVKDYSIYVEKTQNNFGRE